MRRCCVSGCRSNRTKPYVSVFQFPKSSGFRDLWLKKIGQPLLKVTENKGVCIKHFEKHFLVFNKDWSAESCRKRVGVKPGAVPTIFDREELHNLSDDADDTKNKESSNVNARMHPKVRKSQVHGSNAPDDSADISPTKSLQTSPAKSLQASPKKSVQATTDKPFIAVIKPDDCKMDDSNLTDGEENIESSADRPSSVKKSGHSSKSNLNALPSPYKHLPTVTVCLKEEDRMNVQRELGKSLKRSSSICSTGSNGSTEVAKPKRRKAEKPAPTVIGRQNDCYCWICHRENIVLCCIACPRAFHQKCAGEYLQASDWADWVCPECRRILTAENVDTQSKVLSEISLDKLCTLLRFSLNKMKHRAGVAFHQPVSLEHYPMYLHYVIHPMDFSLLEKNIKQKLYGCTEAFLADVKWILHNSCVFNGNQHPLSTNAKSMVKTCENDMQEIEVCPDCFMHSIVRNKYWFSEVCRKPHPLVWAKLKGFPYWPAKVVRIADGNVDARFFGAHDRAWVPITQCYHLSKETPTSSKPKKKGNYETALDELSVHVQLLIQKFGVFEYAPSRITFDPDNKFLAFHGINVDEVDRDEIPCNVAVKEVVCASPKEAESDEDDKEDSTPADTLAKANAKSTPEKKTSEAMDEDKLLNIQSSSIVTLKEVDSEKLQNSKKNTTVNSPEKEESLSDSNQVNKIALALQRIKGYISIDNEADKDNDPKDNLPKPTEANKESNSAKPEEISFLKDLIKNKTLPSLDLPDIPPVPVEEGREKEKEEILDATKKSDFFMMELTKTIESCKAKLGISGDPLEKTDSADSDSAEDEDDDEDDEEDEENDDDAKDEEQECGDKAAVNESMSEEDASEESSSESDDESESSETDIELLEEVDDTVSKDPQKTSDENSPEENDIEGSREREITINSGESSSASNPVEKSTERQGNDATDKSDSEEEVPLNQLKGDMGKDQNEHISPRDGEVSTVSLSAQEKELKDQEKDAHNNSENRTVAVVHNGVTPKQSDTSRNSESTNDETSKGDPSEDEKSSEDEEKAVDKDENMEDDDIFICNSPPEKPPTPPLICLDDGTETEPEDEEASEPNTKKPRVSAGSQISHNMDVAEHITPINTKEYLAEFSTVKLKNTNARKSMKRQRKSLSTEESSDDEILVVPSAPRTPLSGAKRTFNGRERKTVHTSVEEEISLNPQYNEVSLRERALLSANEMAMGNNVPNESNQESENVEEPNQNFVYNATVTLEEKDAEILRLKKKLSCLFAAVQLQHWKHNQEKAELRHNMNLIVMEMRASLEADKKQAIEILSQSNEKEKQRCMEEIKSKQWCSHCHQESRYACCWNTSYCTVACQKRHFSEHRNFCSQLKGKVSSFEVHDTKSAASTASIVEGKDNKKLLVLNVMPQTDNAKSGDTQSEKFQKVSLAKIVPPKSHLVSTTSSSSGNTTLQFVLAAPAKSDNTSLPIQTKLIMPKPDTSQNKKDESKDSKPDSSVTLLKNNFLPRTFASEKPEEEKSLEDIYFPSPPTVSFEGLDTAAPDENVRFVHLADVSETRSSDTEQAAENKTDYSSGEEDVIFSDNDEFDNEMVSIGRGIEVKAKFLNKCLIYGRNAKRLTRCLVDVIFPDSKLLATCSAFGNKSNVTKLTRAALPARKVEAIIDFVLKRYPESSRTEIVLAINMKCKEARRIVAKVDCDGNVKKTLFRRLLAKEKKQETSTTAESSIPTKTQTVTVIRNSTPNVVCVQNSTAQSTVTSSNTTALKKPNSGPNIFRCNPQILIRPKPMTTLPKLLVASPGTRLSMAKQPTRTMPLSRTVMSTSKESGKVLVPLEVLKKSSVNKQTNPSSSNTNSKPASQRPYIILGSPASSSSRATNPVFKPFAPLALARK